MNLCHSTDGDGVSILNPSSQALHQLLEDLHDRDMETEHPDVSLTNDTLGWCLSVYPNGTVTLENLDKDEEFPRFLKFVSRMETMEMWLELKNGRIESILSRAWERE